MGATLLADAEVQSRLKELNGWSRSGNEILKLFELSDFVHAMGFVNSVALLAERLNHHPDINIRWNKVTLTSSTHSTGGLTQRDFALAKLIDAL
ncbi:MAG: 4a-hydroxytetrahydrobiopterin dehydratase [Ignavibacteria bacterium]|nr:4a-hydroxytetrahydrobiopterin dehydratase [Ignavibacteria bacterium]